MLRIIMFVHGMLLVFVAWFLHNQVNVFLFNNISLKINIFIGSTPLASYRIVSIEPARSIPSYTSGNVRWFCLVYFLKLYLFVCSRILVRIIYERLGQCKTPVDLGPYGDRDDQQVFVQKVVPFETNQIYVRFCSTGISIFCIK